MTVLQVLMLSLFIYLSLNKNGRHDDFFAK